MVGAAAVALALASPAGTAAIATTAGTSGPALAAPAARATAVDVFIEVNPNTIQAGFQVGVRASCGEDLNPAAAHSRAFGEITLVPQHGSRVMFGSATVPSTTRAGDYPVELRCANGATATAELFVIAAARPTRGPDTGGGGTADRTGNAAPILLAGGGLAALAAGAWLLRPARRSARRPT